MNPSRRTLLCAGAGFAASAAGVDGAANAGGRCDASTAEGAFGSDPEARAAAARDFGNILHKEPRVVLRPSTAAEIANALRWARERGLKVAARGQGHSTYGRAMSDGVVIDMSALGAIHAVQPDRIVADAGATWKSVLEAALARGLTPPVLTNYLGLSVGGTLAVGGIGGSSSHHGMQTDHVLELQVVTGNGDALTCSPRENTALFDVVRGGLAQCAIVTRATLRLIRAPQRVGRVQLLYRDLPSLLADQRRALADGRFDQLQGAILPDGVGGWRYQLDGARFYDGAARGYDLLADLSDERGKATTTDVTFGDDALAFAKLEAMLRSNRQWFNPQPWFFSFLRDSNAEEIVAETLRELTDADVGPVGRVTLYPIHTAAMRSPLVRMPDDATAFVFNLVRIPASNDAALAQRMIAHNRAIYDRIRAAGGVQYPVGAFPMTPADWQAHFASRWPLLRDAKLRHDASNVLTPGYGVF